MNLKEQFERCTRFGINILDLVMFHELKFPKVDPEIQERKVYEEYTEFQRAIEKQDKIDEAVDCIISLIGYLSKNDVDVEKAIRNKFGRVLEKPYPDNFHHVENIEKENK